MAGPADYDAYIERMRQTEYPMLKDALYLDHAGSTLYSKMLMDRFHTDMVTSLYGNPHSASPSSQRSTQAIEAVRTQALQYFGAAPDDFDLVFTANTTAAIKLVMEAFREQEDGFWYGYHVDSHTSLVGVREVASRHRCFASDGEVDFWLAAEDDGGEDMEKPGLFAYPAQSNMNGRRLPKDWPRKLRTKAHGRRIYTLCDAAAYAATSPMNMDEAAATSDFTVLSFAKIFGFPDLGALIVKKDAAHVFQQRKYFGGGTVDMVVCLKEQWHVSKSGMLHEQLEDGTLPVHSILALRSAMHTHTELFKSLEEIADHTSALAKQLCEGLESLRHGDGTDVCKMYRDTNAVCGDQETQGPTIAFNLRDGHGRWISNTEVEKLAAVKNIHLRTGGLCNPGGVANSLHLEPWEMRENFSAGFRCGNENDIMHGRPTGVVRVSLGAMSTRRDVQRFVKFIDEFFTDKTNYASTTPSLVTSNRLSHPRYCVETLTVYPIKSCSGWQIPCKTEWDVRREGLAWDREWCLVKQGTGAALSQKAHPRMALIRPNLDFQNGVLCIKLAGSAEQIAVPLSKDPSYLAASAVKYSNVNVCGDAVQARLYTSKEIADFFTNVVGVPCTLARFPAASPASPSIRHSKAHLLRPGQTACASRPILLSNESPILTINRSSLDKLNETIKASNGKAAHHAVFRANIVLAEDQSVTPNRQQPWAEDKWRGMQIGAAGGPRFEVLGGCRRCQMVCVDQESGERNQEPFVSLAKTRRFDGRVLFGVHTCLVDRGGGGWTIRVGDLVRTWEGRED